MDGSSKNARRYAERIAVQFATRPAAQPAASQSSSTATVTGAPVFPCGDIARDAIHLIGADKVHKLLSRWAGVELELTADGQCTPCAQRQAAMNAACARLEAWIKKLGKLKFWKGRS